MTTTLRTQLLPAPPVDEAAARRSLRDQIARLDGELAALGAPLAAPDAGAGRGATVLGLAELERTRDALAARAAAVRQQLDALGERQEIARRAREEMLLEPERHRLARITNADVGEPGCRDWHVRPRFGLLGMLAGWWRVVVSSGCPLPRAPRRPRYAELVIEEGQTAPDFELQDQDGSTVKLSSLRGSPVVLYFYPKADTPGCTTQACGIRDRSGEYDASGAKVLGVSPDTPAKLRKFADKYGLDFTLLADPEHQVAETYGTWVEKSMYGKKYMGVQRDTFVIDADGKIARILRKVQPKTHDDVVLEALEQLAPAA